jgi:hypothetical protein
LAGHKLGERARMMTCVGEEDVSRVRTPVSRDADLTLGVAEASVIACAKPNGAGTRSGLVSVWYHQSVALTLRTDAELERALDLLLQARGPLAPGTGSSRGS